MPQQVVCCLLLQGRFELPGHQHSFESFFFFIFFCCGEVHQAAGGEINETGSFSCCHWSLKEGGFRSAQLEEWEDPRWVLSPALRGRPSGLADVVWLRSVSLITGVLYMGNSNFSALYPSLLLGTIKSVVSGVFTPWWWRARFSLVGHSPFVSGTVQTCNRDCICPCRLNQAPLLGT